MAQARFQHNANYREHEQLLLRLHDLIAAGDGDSDQADAVREQMDASWWELTLDEQDMLGALSADLYQLQDDEIYEVIDDPERIALWTAQLQQAVQQSHWPEVLELLRARPATVPAAEVATLRVTAYSHLGHEAAAAAFAEHARRSGSRAQEGLLAGV